MDESPRLDVPPTCEVFLLFSPLNTCIGILSIRVLPCRFAAWVASDIPDRCNVSPDLLAPTPPYNFYLLTLQGFYCLNFICIAFLIQRSSLLFFFSFSRRLEKVEATHFDSVPQQSHNPIADVTSFLFFPLRKSCTDFSHRGNYRAS